MSKNKQSKAGIFFLGTTIGTLAGMMFAQKKGSQLRKEMLETAEIIKDKAVDMLENKEEVIETIKEVIEKAMNKDQIIKYETPDYYEKEFNIEDDETLHTSQKEENCEEEITHASEFEVDKD